MSLRRADHSSRGVLPTVLRRCVWSTNIKNGCSIYIYTYIYIYIYDSRLRVNWLFTGFRMCHKRAHIYLTLLNSSHSGRAEIQIKFAILHVESSWNVMAHGDARRGSEGETGEWSGYPVLFTLPRNMVYPALLPLMRTLRLPVVDWTDVPAYWNGLVCFAERRTLVSARALSHFKRSLLPCLRVSRPKHQLQAVLYSGTYLTDSFSKVLEKLIVLQIVTKLPTPYGTRRFITAFRRVRNPPVPLATSSLGGGFTHLT